MLSVTCYDKGGDNVFGWPENGKYYFRILAPAKDVAGASPKTGRPPPRLAGRHSITEHNVKLQ